MYQYFGRVCQHQGKIENLTVADSLPHLLLTIHVMNSLPKLSDSEKERWLSPNNHPEDIQAHSLMQTIFYLLNKCSVEAILPVCVPGLSSKKDKYVCLYDEICVHFCGFIGSLPAKHFHKLEEVLIVNLLSTSPVCSQLATDTWCFLVSIGKSEEKVVLHIKSQIEGKKSLDIVIQDCISSEYRIEGRSILLWSSSKM
ncbi:unnamed protein product [Mytilus coruscus]|uniref:Uncharacterized protein n=1 Tax=Mytilus coruscus TaxID=42192 RepID=A0A6J8DK46_MYTCO|nr:unnamed protein product [Mytilus coruscus]